MLRQPKLALTWLHIFIIIALVTVAAGVWAGINNVLVVQWADRNPQQDDFENAHQVSTHKAMLDAMMEELQASRKEQYELERTIDRRDTDIATLAGTFPALKSSKLIDAADIPSDVVDAYLSLQTDISYSEALMSELQQEVATAQSVPSTPAGQSNTQGGVVDKAEPLINRLSEARVSLIEQLTKRRGMERSYPTLVNLVSGGGLPSEVVRDYLKLMSIQRSERQYQTYLFLPYRKFVRMWHNGRRLGW